MPLRVQASIGGQIDTRGLWVKSVRMFSVICAHGQQSIQRLAEQTDMTANYTRQDGQVALLIAVAHDAAACMGIQAAKPRTRFAALEPIRQGVRTDFGLFGQDITQGLLLRHDHGRQYRSQVFQEELRFFGISSSPAFVHKPEGNGCAELCLRPLKENILWPKTFATVGALRLALHEFQRRYNEIWLIGRHGYKAPAQVRQEQQCTLAAAASL